MKVLEIPPPTSPRPCMSCADFYCLLEFGLVTFCYTWVQLASLVCITIFWTSVFFTSLLGSIFFTSHAVFFNSGFDFCTLFGPIWPLCYLTDLLGSFLGVYLVGFAGRGGFFFSSPELLLSLPVFCGCAFLDYIFLVHNRQISLSSAGTVSWLKAAWPWFAWHGAQANISCLSAGLASSVSTPWSTSSYAFSVHLGE